MQPIQINVSVSIGVNQELYGLLSSLASRPQVEAEAAAPVQRKPKTSKPQTIAESKPEPQPEPAKEEPTPESQTEAALVAKSESAPQTDKPATLVDVRGAIDRTRKRIEGENYKEKTDSEAYQKWHRPLTDFFKKTARALGYDKPSVITDGEACAKFIAACDAVSVKDDELIEDLPF